MGRAGKAEQRIKLIGRSEEGKRELKSEVLFNVNYTERVSKEVPEQ